MIPTAHRLRHRQDFNAVYRSGLRQTTTHLTLRALRQEAKGSLASARALPDTVFPTRIGISISQKVSKKAVVRNRIKRQIRGALRQLLPHLSTGWRIVVVVKPNATECGYEQFLQELKQLLTNAEVMDGC